MKVNAWIRKNTSTVVYKSVEVEECPRIKHYHFKCPKCHRLNDYWATSDAFSYRCQHCKDTGEIEIPRKVNSYLKEIPTWRLHVDDVGIEELLTTPSSEFGIEPRTEEEWRKYYDSPHEKEHERRVEANLKKKEEELAKSLDSMVKEDSDT